MGNDSRDEMKLSTALWLLTGTAVLVAGTLFALEHMQPVVLRGVVVDERLRNARTVISLRHETSPKDLLKVKPDAEGCFAIRTEEVDTEAGALLLHVKRGRHRAMTSPVGPMAATEFVVSRDGDSAQAKLTVVQADAEAKKAHARCFEPSS